MYSEKLHANGQMVQQGPGEFTESPGYQFRLDEGNRNILGAASATGGLASGRTLKALTEYGQDYASNEYNNFLNQYYQSLTPYQSLAGIGQTAAMGLGNLGLGTANAISGNQQALANVYQTQGISNASGYMAQGNALAGNAMSQGNIAANQYMGQGNISAQNSMNQSNAWTNAINQGMTGLGMYMGNRSIQPSTPAPIYTNNPSPNPGYDFY